MTTFPNPDFKAFPPHREVAHAADRGDKGALLDILADRDRSIEDYLNRHVLRRKRASYVLGDNATYAATAWTTVASGPSVGYAKAADESVLVARVDVNGKLPDAVIGAWVAHGVELLDPSATSLGTTECCRATYVVAQVDDYVHNGGEVEIAAIPAGFYAVRLKVKVNAATTTWQPTGNSSLTLTVVESHAA